MKHVSQKAPEPVGPYPHARRVGDFIFVSGIGPREIGTKTIPGVDPYDFALQARRTIENIKMILEEMGSSLNDVVDCSCFLTNLKQDFQTFNEVYGEYFAKIGPTRTTVEVTALPTAIAVELKVIAYQPTKD